MTRATGQLQGHPRCPYCGAMGDGFTPIEDEPHVPRPGDVAICAYCDQLQIYEAAPDGMGLRRATPAELEDLRADPEIARAQAALLIARERAGVPRRPPLQ